MSSQKNIFQNYLSLVKFSHTVFALPFACIGFFIAVKLNHFPFSIKIFALVLLCMIFARSAAMAFNRYIDKDIDSKNDRTKNREIPAGIISAKSALLFTILNAGCFIAATYFINPLCFFLSPIALLVILGYSYTKRFTFLCHLVLGIGLSLAPIGAYIAVTGKFALLPLLYSFAVLCWVSGFDMIYAMQDEDFDKSEKLFSVPASFGKKFSLRFSNLLHFLCFAFIAYAGYSAHFGYWYWIGTGIFTALLIYQHTLVKPNDLSRVNIAFMTTNGIASVVFAIFVIVDLYFRA
ncbi:MAG: UbiA-like polyprenyltransferase [Bacteroidia bacterium]